MTPADEPQLQAAIGPRTAYYLERFEKIRQGGGRWVATWNASAFFFSTAWFAFRGMHGYSFANLALAIVAALMASMHGAGAILFAAAYVVAAFVIVPMYANQFYYLHLKRLVAQAASGNQKAQKRLRGPSAANTVNAAITGAFVLVLCAFLVLAPAAYVDYAPRARVAESVATASSMIAPIGEFHSQHKRLPAPHEAGRFSIDGGKSGRSFTYDADKRMIVVTLGPEDWGVQNKRLALFAEEKDGVIDWKCRTVDLERRYLPKKCRQD